MDLKKCENCVYYNDPLFKVSDCDKCVDNDGYLSWEDFNEEMDMDNIPPEAFKPEKFKKRYLLIRWLIELIEKYESNYAWVYFDSIVKNPVGKEQKNDAPMYLSWYFKKVWVNEIYNGGSTGDIWGGTFYYKLLPGMYLCFGYDA